MDEKSRTLLKKARVLFISMTAGIIFLAVESLWTDSKLLQHYALGLGVFALLILSLIIARIVKAQD